MIDRILQERFPAPPSLHRKARQDYDDFIAMVKAVAGSRCLVRQKYGTRLELHGSWERTRDGTPRPANTINAGQRALDAIADAFGLGSAGRGDEWLQWPVLLVPVQDSGEPYMVVTVVPASEWGLI